jgi:recombination protein RecA
LPVKSKTLPIEIPADRASQITALRGKYKDILEAPVIEPVTSDQVLRTPSHHINDLIGRDDGIRQGSVITWYGPQGSLKTWVGLEMCREAQLKWPDKIVAYIDCEFRVDMTSATEAIGVNVEPFEDGTPRFIYRRLQCCEDVWQMVYDFAATRQFSFIAIDSVSALLPRKVMDESEMKIPQIGHLARLHSAILPQISTHMVTTDTILWMISQERINQIEPIVEYGWQGGNAVGFYSSHIFRSRRMPKVWEDTTRELTIWLEKNKYGMNLRKTTIPIVLGRGINTEGDLLLFASEVGAIQKAGSWYKFDGDQIGQGLEQCSRIIRDNPALAEKITAKITEVYHPNY